MKKLAPCVSVWTVFAVLLPVPLIGQHGTQPTFRARADYVEVDAFVTDSQGRFVRTLQKDDFTILEDGKRVPVSTLELIDLPRSAATPAAPSPPSDVVTNAVAADGRVYFIVLDDLHVEADNSPRARRTALDFVEHNVGPHDLAAILRTSGRSEGSQELTSNHQALKDAIGQFIGHKVASAAMATAGGSVPVGMRPGEHSPLEMERENQARASLESLGQVVTYARSLQGRRKALVMISEGMDFDLGARTTSIEVREAMHNLIDAANRAMLSIYTIDPRGLSQGGEHASELTGNDASQTSLQDAVQTSTDSLRTLAAGTGGRFFLRSSNVAPVFAAIDDVSSTYYVLTYSSPAPEDGKFHSIDVRVAKPDLKINARKGYVRVPNPPPVPTRALAELSSELDSALADPRPATGLQLATVAAVFRGTSTPAVSVLIHVRGSSLSFFPVDGKQRAELEVALLAFDSTGRSRNGDRTSLRMDLSEENHARAQNDGIVVPFRLDLPSGHYQLHVGARDPSTAKIGALRYDVAVPAFPPSAVTVSSVLLASDSSSSPPFVRRDETSERLLGHPATLARDFSRDETLIAGVEIYGKPAGDVPIVAELQGTDRRIIPACRASATGGEPQSCAVRIPLATLAPGGYTFRFVTDSTPGTKVESSEVAFRIR
jgi:VWFA-related protein